MITYIERARLAAQYEEWRTENNVKDCPLSVISFLEGIGRLKEKEPDKPSPRDIIHIIKLYKKDFEDLGVNLMHCLNGTFAWAGEGLRGDGFATPSEAYYDACEKMKARGNNESNL